MSCYITLYITKAVYAHNKKITVLNNENHVYIFSPYMGNAYDRIKMHSRHNRLLFLCC